jgi:hypothetical protein
MSLELVQELEKFRRQSDLMVMYSYAGIGATIGIIVLIKLGELIFD